MTSPLSLKDIAVTFLQHVAVGEVEHAYEAFIGPEFRHHNPYFAGDADSLKQGMADNARQYPGKRLEVLRALQDGNLVAVHSRMRLTADAPSVALVHLFRFEGDRIVELWDIGQPEPAGSPNAHGMF